MNKKELIESLEDIPDDADINLSSFILLTEEDGPWHIILDQPIHGIAYNEGTNEVCFAVAGKNYEEAHGLASFGVKEVKKL